MTVFGQWRAAIAARPRRGDGNPGPDEVAFFETLSFREVRQRAAAAWTKAEQGGRWHKRYLDAEFVWHRLEKEMRQREAAAIGDLDPQRIKYWARRIDLVDPDGLTGRRHAERLRATAQTPSASDEHAEDKADEA